MLLDTRLPTDEDAKIAKASSVKLAPFVHAPASRIQLQIADASGKVMEEAIPLPRALVELLAQTLAEMARGNAVNFTPVHAHLTTQEAADFLNVSRPFVIKEIDERRIPCQMVGTHRRIALNDLLAYKRQCIEKHNRAMDELVQQAQELNLGY